MSSLIETPDILPNNMKQIKAMRMKTTHDIVKDLSLNPSYISVIENWKLSISSVTAFKLMQYLNANFEQFFDLKQKIKLPVIHETTNHITITIILNKDKMDTKVSLNHVHVEEIISTKLKASKIEGKVGRFDITKTKARDNETVEAIVYVELLNHEKVEKEFDINLMKNMNYDLFVKLNNMQFTNDNSNSIKERFSNIAFISEYLNLSPEEIQPALGITKKTYDNIIKDTQKLSLKIMWRMVVLFKVPLELIINIPLYLETYSN